MQLTVMKDKGLLVLVFFKLNWLAKTLRVSDVE